MQSPMTLLGGNDPKQYLFEKNTFLEVKSPWEVQTTSVHRKSVSDPGTSKTRSIFSIGKNASQGSLGDSDRCSTGTGSQAPSECSFDAWESSGHFFRDASLSDEDDAWLSAPGVEHPSAPKSSAHENGTCKPCKFFARPGGCRLGSSCGFCHNVHLPSHPSAKLRLNRKRRHALREVFSQTTVVLRDGDRDPSCEFGELPSWIANNPWVMQRFIGRVAEQAAEPQLGVVYRL